MSARTRLFIVDLLIFVAMLVALAGLLALSEAAGRILIAFISGLHVAGWSRRLARTLVNPTAPKVTDRS